MTTDSKLKNCPFCGSDQAKVDYETSDEIVESLGYEIEDFEYSSDGSPEEIFHYVFCLSCGGRTDDYFTPEDAVEAWNKRPDEARPKSTEMSLPPRQVAKMYVDYEWKADLVVSLSPDVAPAIFFKMLEDAVLAAVEGYGGRAGGSTMHQEVRDDD